MKTQLALFALLAGCTAHGAESASQTFTPVHEVNVGILMKDLGTAAYEEEQRVWFKKALSQVVNTIWDQTISYPVSAIGDPPPPEFWIDTQRETDRRDNVLRALKDALSAGYDGEKLELVSDRSSAGCVPRLKDCTDPRTCPWDSFRAYQIKYDGAVMVCAQAVALYNQWRIDGVHSGEAIKSTSELMKLQLYALHSHKFVPTP